jgi:hypothetical protein
MEVTKMKGIKIMLLGIAVILLGIAVSTMNFFEFFCGGLGILIALFGFFIKDEKQ